MSVTFCTEAPTLYFEIACYARGRVATRFATHAEAYAEQIAMLTRGEHPKGCADEYCLAMGHTFIDAVCAMDTHEVNLSNVNARFILGNLGLVTEEGADMSGTLDAEDFLGRVLLAAALSPEDEGIPSHAASSTGATMVECGRRAGYLHEVLDSLRAVADDAIRLREKVYWG